MLYKTPFFHGSHTATDFYLMKIKKLFPTDACTAQSGEKNTHYSFRYIFLRGWPYYISLANWINHETRFLLNCNHTTG